MKTNRIAQYIDILYLTKEKLIMQIKNSYVFKKIKNVRAKNS